MQHECKREWEVKKIDKCYGINPMILECWYLDTDGLEEYCDAWRELKVNFCPFFGAKSGEIVDFVNVT